MSAPKHHEATSYRWNVMFASVRGGEGTHWTCERAAHATSSLLRDRLGLSTKAVRFYSDERHNSRRVQTGVGLRTEHSEPMSQSGISAAIRKAQELLNGTMRIIDHAGGKVDITFEINPGNETERETGLVEVIEEI